LFRAPGSGSVPFRSPSGKGGLRPEMRRRKKPRKENRPRRNAPPLLVFFGGFRGGSPLGWRWGPEPAGRVGGGLSGAGGSWETRNLDLRPVQPPLRRRRYPATTWVFGWRSRSFFLLRVSAVYLFFFGDPRPPDPVGNPWRRGRKTEEINRGDAETRRRKDRMRRPLPTSGCRQAEPFPVGTWPRPGVGVLLLFLFPALSSVFFFLEDPPLPGFSCTRKTPAILPSGSASPENPGRRRVGTFWVWAASAGGQDSSFLFLLRVTASPRFHSSSSEILVPRIRRHREAPLRPAWRLRKPHSNPEGNLLGNPRKSHSAHKTRKRQEEMSGSWPPADVSPQRTVSNDGPAPGVGHPTDTKPGSPRDRMGPAPRRRWRGPQVS